MSNFLTKATMPPEVLFKVKRKTNRCVKNANVVLGKRILTFNKNGFVTVSLFRYQFSFDIGSYPI